MQRLEGELSRRTNEIGCLMPGMQISREGGDARSRKQILY